jgi:hypothetical protein
MPPRLPPGNTPQLTGQQLHIRPPLASVVYRGIPRQLSLEFLPIIICECEYLAIPNFPFLTRVDGVTDIPYVYSASKYLNRVIFQRDACH